jgi:hypothetical protein
MTNSTKNHVRDLTILTSAALLLAPLAALYAFAGEASSAAPVVPKDIKAYCLDFNWRPSGPNAFAKPGLWADADPAQRLAWHRAMGVNVMLRMPTSRKSNGGRGLDCEKKLYAQLMGESFPGEQELPAAKMTEFGRRAVDRAWAVIRKAAKETKPNCTVWLTCCDIHDPHIANSRALRETDWLLNESGESRARWEIVISHTKAAD